VSLLGNKRRVQANINMPILENLSVREKFRFKCLSIIFSDVMWRPELWIFVCHRRMAKRVKFGMLTKIDLVDTRRRAGELSIHVNYKCCSNI
jgi:hypothetical protein